MQFALAKALDDVGDYARAFEHLRRGNALKRRQIDYRETQALQLIERIRTVFDSSLIRRFARAGDPSSAPVFVLGMARSGSTLVEQTLASHPQIHGAGELTILEKLEDQGFPESVVDLNGPALRRLGESYLSRLPKVAPGKLRIVDKLPGNFLRIGLIRMMLPNARIIHTVRDPVDTCLSCYSKLFSDGLGFTYDLAELGRLLLRLRRTDEALAVRSAAGPHARRLVRGRVERPGRSSAAPDRILRPAVGRSLPQFPSKRKTGQNGQHCSGPPTAVSQFAAALAPL